MSELTLDQATVILDTTLSKGAEMGLNPLTVAIVDSGGSLKAFKRQDGLVRHYGLWSRPVRHLAPSAWAAHLAHWVPWHKTAHTSSTHWSASQMAD